MQPPPDPKVADDFRKLLDTSSADENAIQRFLEEHTAFIETPHLLNHHLHLNCVITKLTIGPWKTDFAYLTKSTVGWRLVLVELERSDKRLFQSANKYNAFNADLGNAIAQIDTWRDQWNAEKDHILRKLEPLLVPYQMRHNPLSPHYVLIIGRDKEFKADDSKKRRLEALMQEKNLQILTYDTLLRTYEEGRGYRKCVLSPTARGFRIKHLDGEPAQLFSHLEPQHLEVSGETEATLVSWGFDIPSWRKGEPLIVNHKITERTARELAKAGGSFLQTLTAPAKH